MPRLCWTAALFVAVTVVCSCSADLKPLTMAEKLKFAKHVFVGTVTALEHKDISRAPTFPDWITRHYKATVTVDKILQTTKHSHANPSHPADETLTVGQTVHVMLWEGIGRPSYFTGDRGARMVPRVGEPFSFYTHFLHPNPNLRSMYHESFPHVEEEQMKAYNVLMPNGIGEAPELVPHIGEL